MTKFEHKQVCSLAYLQVIGGEGLFLDPGPHRKFRDTFKEPIKFSVESIKFGSLKANQRRQSIAKVLFGF
jgi:hypothetical protein